MYGLVVRWSLQEAPAGAEDRLRAYVREVSLERFSGLGGLCFKLWRMVPGQWFEGTYVWDSPQSRARFLETFRAAEDLSPVSQIVGAVPDVYQDYEVVGVAEGGTRFAEGAGPGTL